MTSSCDYVVHACFSRLLCTFTRTACYVNDVPLTCVMLHVRDVALHLVLRGDVLPGGEEDALVHLAVLDEQRVHGQLAGEVEDVDAVLDGHLQVCERLHALHGARRVERQAGVEALVGQQRRSDVERLRWDQPKTATRTYESAAIHVTIQTAVLLVITHHNEVII